MTIMRFTRTVIKNLFSKPVTSQYPFVKREYPIGTRGRVDIQVEDCIFCGICSKKCPANVIKVNKELSQWEIDPFGCISCAACVGVCPKKCLSMNKEYTSPSPEKSNLIYNKQGD